MVRRGVVAIAMSLTLAPAARAHPGVGIVRDARGNIFYTDLVHVWRIAPDGRKSIAVRDVHTHELAIDSAGNLYGEDSRYQGGDRWRHRVWRRRADGRISDIVPWTEGFWREYGFVHDSAGGMYWVSCPERRCTIRRRAANGSTSVVATPERFTQQINWIAAGPGRSLYVLDGRALRRLERDGRTITLVRDVGESPMGLRPDGNGGVYLAVYGARAIKRVSASGDVSIVARSSAPWGPSGIAVAPNGDRWILEYSTTNAARVRRVDTRGRATLY
jgi:hypothetical protein